MSAVDGFFYGDYEMKQSVKNAIEDIYSLFKKPPKQTNKNINNVKQHIQDFADKPDHFHTRKWECDNETHNLGITKLKAALNKVKGSKRCVWCAKSAADVQQSLINDWYKEEYQISALCGDCQDEVFIGAPDLREEVK